MSDKVIQLGEARKEKQEHLKREYERVLFQNILGCYTVIEKVGLKSVELFDISKSGVSFRMPVEEGKYNLGEEIDFRFYFSQKTYLPSRLTIKRVGRVTEAGRDYWSFGCAFDREASTFPAIEKFVNFIESYSECAKEDKGEKQVWFL